MAYTVTMFKTLITAVVLGVLSAGCGTVCDQMAASERGISDKARSCNGSHTSTNHDATSCNQGLSHCSPDDQAAMGQYADCLDRQPNCDPNTSLSWSLSVAACSQPLSHVSFACASSL